VIGLSAGTRFGTRRSAGKRSDEPSRDVANVVRASMKSKHFRRIAQDAE
jgi:hypothetical protein